MSQLQQVPSTNTEGMEQWFDNLSEDEKIEVIRDLVTITAETHIFMVNSIIPSMKLSAEHIELRDILAVRMILSAQDLNSAGLLSPSSLSLMVEPEPEEVAPEESSVFSMPECIFKYCPTRDNCEINGCQSKA